MFACDSLKYVEQYRHTVLGSCRHMQILFNLKNRSRSILVEVVPYCFQVHMPLCIVLRLQKSRILPRMLGGFIFFTPAVGNVATEDQFNACSPLMKFITSLTY